MPAQHVPPHHDLADGARHDAGLAEEDVRADGGVQPLREALPLEQVGQGVFALVVPVARGHPANQAAVAVLAAVGAGHAPDGRGKEGGDVGGDVAREAATCCVNTLFE